MAQDNVKNVQNRDRESLGQRVKGVRQEMKKVVWPTRQELGTYSLVVIITCLFFSLLFWGLDSAVLASLRALLGVNV